ncbi:hypothetical protein H8959_001694 [Pygathrix nigripes]
MDPGESGTRSRQVMTPQAAKVHNNVPYRPFKGLSHVRLSAEVPAQGSGSGLRAPQQHACRAFFRRRSQTSSRRKTS